MTVPKASTLGPGVAVNIVLKADQPTGRLTTGRIQDLLSRGDHPRGIKVRLQDGRIGRVQSLAGGEASSVSSSNTEQQSFAPSLQQSRQYKFQDDYRGTAAAVPPSSGSSLDAYIKIKPARRRGKTNKKIHSESEGSNLATSDDIQATLQNEFPGLDSSLIAAILSDSDDTETARSTLRALAAG